LKNIIIAGGGTFGHIAPSLALKKYLEGQELTVFYACAAKDSRFPFFAKESHLLPVKLGGMPRKNPIAFIKFLWTLWKCLRNTKKIMRHIKPDSVIATGGFVAYPYLYWAKRFKIPFYICEQNSFPGLVNRLYAPKAKAVFQSMKDFSGKLKGNLILTGNPILLKPYTDKISAAKSLGITYDPQSIYIGVVGGSQGATRLNSWVMKHQDELEQRKIHILLSAGKNNFAALASEKKSPRLAIFEFIEDMGAFYCICDTLVCRAGASTIAEILYLNKSALFVPYPFATDNHQYYNSQFASSYVKSQILLEKNLDQRSLFELLDEIAKQPEKERKTNFSETLPLIYQYITKK
jgi:UDP-N-acetylglucosamine--N-acetylmuramyl-(pentapeptide) pyrophosphoryl-undecaprenol N-acetylglucosamine transferase